MEWIYKNSYDNTSRYILGIKGDNPLICFGVNPSTAEPGTLDNTMKSVDRIAKNNGYDSWIMLNLYPQRATNPNDMDKEFDQDIFEENLKHIQEIFSNKEITVWAAWGTLIKKRKYLKKCLSMIVDISSRSRCNWVSFGEKSKDGHPHHPLYLGKEEIGESFDINEYLQTL